MSGERIFAAVNTKIRVLKSKLLKEDDYVRLMEMENIDEQIKYLRSNTVYIDELKKLHDIRDIQHVEAELERHLIHQFDKLLKFFTDEYKTLFKTFLLRHEIEDLKLYLRVLERKEDIEQIAKSSVLKEKHYNFDTDIIESSSNLDEFIENLKGTIFYKVLDPYRNEDEARIIFYMEMNLDRMYFNRLYSASQDLRKEDRELLGDFLGRNIDLLNIEWIYRGLKFYNLLPEELINYTLPHGLYFKYEDLKKMSYSDLDELREIVATSKYSFLLDDEKDVDLYLERRVQRYLRDISLDYFKKARTNISISIAYLHLLEYEIRDIISILEATNYGLTKDQTKDYLVRQIEGSDYN